MIRSTPLHPTPLPARRRLLAAALTLPLLPTLAPWVKAASPAAAADVVIINGWVVPTRHFRG